MIPQDLLQVHHQESEMNLCLAGLFKAGPYK